MSEAATKQDIRALQESMEVGQKALQGEIHDVLDVMRDFMGQVSDRFDTYDEEFRKLNKNYDHLVNTMAAS